MQNEKEKAGLKGENQETQFLFIMLILEDYYWKSTYIANCQDARFISHQAN